MSREREATIDDVLRISLADFVHWCFMELHASGTFQDHPYIDLITSALERCRHGRCRRLIICVPPRTLKSICASVAFPAFLLGHKPTLRILCASYGQDLAEKHARDTRHIMQQQRYRRLFPSARLDPKQSALSDFATTARGGRKATSVTGPLTGHGADFIIIDDPMKPDDAMSEARRKATNDWFDESLLSRLNDKAHGCIIIVMQRLHQDDLVGHVLERGSWEVLSLPAIATEDVDYDIRTPYTSYTYRRRAGEALHPERDSLLALEEMRSAIGEYNFQAQYQQCPVPVGGAMIKRDWLVYYDPFELPERFFRIVQSWDTANKPTELNDYSVCTTWGEWNRRFYLLDVYRRRLAYPELKRAVIDQSRRFGSRIVLIEDKASGTQLIQDLQREIHGIRAYKPPPGSDKVMRLHTQSAEFECGRVVLPRKAAWLDTYVAELLTFPGAKHDDQVDSTTQALDYMKTNSSTLETFMRAAGMVQSK